MKMCKALYRKIIGRIWPRDDGAEELAERVIWIVNNTTVNERPSRGGRGIGSESRRKLQRKIKRAVVRAIRGEN